MIKMKRFDLSILLCNALEHFDSALYAFLAPILASLFFCESDYLSQLIWAYSLLVVSGSAKPLGAYLFTKIALMKNPLFALKYSVYGTSIVNLGMFLLPTYERAGYFATAALVVSRFLVGIFAGGEMSVSRTVIIQKNSYKLSSLYEASSMSGIILASIVSSAVVAGIIQWRILFLVAFFLGGFAYCLRREADKPLGAVRFERKEKFPMKKVLTIFFNATMSNVTYSLPFVVMNSLVPLVNPEISLEEMVRINSYLLVFDLIIFLVFAKLKITMAPKKMIGWSYSLLAISLPFLFQYLTESNILVVTAIRTLIVTTGVAAAVAQNIFYDSLFTDSRHKYIFIGNTIAVSNGLIGKATPVICLQIFKSTSSLTMVALYISLCCIICLYFNSLD